MGHHRFQQERDRLPAALNNHSVQIPFILEIDSYPFFRIDPATNEAPAGTTIERFMQVNIPACFEDDLLCDALARMQRSHLHWLAVVDSGRHLVGVLSRYVVPRQLQAPAAIW